MVFRECSIGGSVYHGDPEDEDMGQKELTEADNRDDELRNDSNGPPRSASSSVVRNPIDATTVKLSSGVLKHFTDQQLAHDLARAIDAEPGSENEAQARALNGFFSVLALCHTVLTAVDPETGAIEYKAQSPDEAALVQAAADVGFIFRGRDKEILMLQTPFLKEIERFELLNILEFTSARKRMSIIVRKLDDEDPRLFLLTKGADSVIFERLKPGGEELKRTTEEHLDDFANAGLRTLTLAYKVIPGMCSSSFHFSFAHILSFAAQRLNTRLGANDTTRLRLHLMIGRGKSRMCVTRWREIFGYLELLRLKIVYKTGYQKRLLT
jgi:phospholipid-translocating ATPase